MHSEPATENQGKHIVGKSTNQIIILGCVAVAGVAWCRN